MIIIYVFLFFLLLSFTINMVATNINITQSPLNKQNAIPVDDRKVDNKKVDDGKIDNKKVDDGKTNDRKTNDIVEIIITNKIYKNIEYDTNGIGKVCNNSKDCSYGLKCSYDGKIKQCARIVPINKCNSNNCQQNKSKLGEMCGGFFLHEYICDDLKKMQCTTTNNANNMNGVCTQLI